MKPKDLDKSISVVFQILNSSYDYKFLYLPTNKIFNMSIKVKKSYHNHYKILIDLQDIQVILGHIYIIFIYSQ